MEIKYFKIILIKKYFKLFDTGKKINNTFYVSGRIDDVLNIRGHRIGSGEIESVILSVKGIKEVSVIDTKDAISGTSIIVFFIFI